MIPAALRLRPALAGLLLVAAAGMAAAQGDPKRGEYLIKAGGCLGCHTEERQGAVPFAGGRAIASPFGTFYGPNITPHPGAGIGRWGEQDFIRAMREGRRPDGAHYYPAFPYTSFTRIVDGDLRDMWAYLRTVPPSAQASREHDLPFFLKWRFLLAVWKWLFFEPGPFMANPALSPLINRGLYLVEALGHCGECHTPRNFLGALKRDRWLAGAELPDGRAPNLTATRLKRWSDAQLAEFLRTGATPEGDAPSDIMYEVVRNTTSQLTPADLAALIAYLRTLPPQPDAAKAK